MNVTTRVPATTEAIRQPNARIPKALIPIAISHLPKRGVHPRADVPLLLRQYCSSLESIVQVSFDHPTRMHAAFG